MTQPVESVSVRRQVALSGKVTTKGWIAPDGSIYKGPWSNPSVLLLMGVLPPDMHRAAQTADLSGEERFALYSFRGTGQFAGADARGRYRIPKPKHKWETLMTLRARGLLEFFCGSQWYLTEAGREYIRKGL